MNHTLLVASAAAKTTVVIAAPKRGPRASIIVETCVEFNTCVILILCVFEGLKKLIVK
jgi:hypothetical protein